MRDEIHEMVCPNCGGTLTVTYHPIMVDQQEEPVRWTVLQTVCTGTGRDCTLTEDQVPERNA